MSYVKVINRETGLPQVITKILFSRIAETDAEHSKKLEYLYDCNDVGEKLEEVKTPKEKVKKEPIIKTPKENGKKNISDNDGEPKLG